MDSQFAAVHAQKVLTQGLVTRYHLPQLCTSQDHSKPTDIRSKGVFLNRQKYAGKALPYRLLARQSILH